MRNLEKLLMEIVMGTVKEVKIPWRRVPQTYFHDRFPLAWLVSLLQAEHNS